MWTETAPVSRCMAATDNIALPPEDSAQDPRGTHTTLLAGPLSPSYAFLKTMTSGLLIMMDACAKLQNEAYT